MDLSSVGEKTVGECMDRVILLNTRSLEIYKARVQM